MSKDLKQKLAQVAMCLLCASVVWRYASELEGTEFSGGWLTGPLLDLKDIGFALFVLSLVLTFFFQKIGAAITTLASLLCLPLYLYFMLPGLFGRVFGGVEKVHLRADFVWNRGTIFGILILVVAVGVGLRGFLATTQRKAPSPLSPNS